MARVLLVWGRGPVLFKMFTKHLNYLELSQRYSIYSVFNMGETIMVFICPANFFCELNPFHTIWARLTLHPGAQRRDKWARVLTHLLGHSNYFWLGEIQAESTEALSSTFAGAKRDGDVLIFPASWLGSWKVLSHELPGAILPCLTIKERGKGEIYNIIKSPKSSFIWRQISQNFPVKQSSKSFFAKAN